MHHLQQNTINYLNTANFLNYLNRSHSLPRSDADYAKSVGFHKSDFDSAPQQQEFSSTSNKNKQTCSST